MVPVVQCLFAEALAGTEVSNEKNNKKGKDPTLRNAKPGQPRYRSQVSWHKMPVRDCTDSPVVHTHPTLHFA